MNCLPRNESRIRRNRSGHVERSALRGACLRSSSDHQALLVTCVGGRGGVRRRWRSTLLRARAANTGAKRDAEISCRRGGRKKASTARQEVLPHGETLERLFADFLAAEVGFIAAAISGALVELTTALRACAPKAFTRRLRAIGNRGVWNLFQQILFWFARRSRIDVHRRVPGFDVDDGVDRPVRQYMLIFPYELSGLAAMPIH